MILASNSGTGVDQVDIVGEEGVTGVLGNDTKGDENGQPPSVTLGLQEVNVAGVGFGIGLHSDGFPHLGVFKVDGYVITVTLGMVVCKSVQRLLVAFLGDQPTWALVPC